MIFVLAFLALSDPVIIPKPLEMTVNSGNFKLVDGIPICYTTKIDKADDVASYAAEFLKTSTGFSLPLKADGTESQAIIFEKSNDQMKEEEYELVVDTASVHIKASTKKGLFYGFVTLLQLFPTEIYCQKVQKEEWLAQAVTIHDYPRFEWRGLMVDCARHFFDHNIIKRLLGYMALHKLNVFHWHLIDDQGWRIEIKKFPFLTTVGSVRDESPKPWDREHTDGKQYGPFFYTQEQIRDIVAYGKRLGITILPEIEMPGHCRSGLAGYPQYTCANLDFKPLSTWSANLEVYCPGNDETFGFIKEIFSEVFELFDSKYIHVGGDEVDKTRWKSCSKCQSLMKKEGIKNVEALQSWFTKQISDYIDSQGRHMIGWDDIIDGGYLVDNAAVMSWRGVEGGKKAAEAGHKVVMTPYTNVYFDYHQTSLSEKYEYNCCLNTLKMAYSLDPQAGVSEGKKANIIGVQGNQWSEYVWGGEGDLIWKLWPRSLAVAEVGWTTLENKNYDRFLAGVTSTHLDRLHNLGMETAPIADNMVQLPKFLSTEKRTYWVLPHALEGTNAFEVAFVAPKSQDVHINNIMIEIDGKRIGPKDVSGKATENEAFSFDFVIPFRAQGKQKIRISAEIPEGEKVNKVLIYPQ